MKNVFITCEPGLKGLKRSATDDNSRQALGDQVVM